MKRPTRIFRIVPSLEMGGVERTLTSILPRLDKCQYKVYLCCLFKRDKLADTMESLGIPIISFKMRARLDFDGKYIAGILRLACLMKKMQIDIVHTHLYRANLVGRIAAKLAGVPVIIANEHNIDSWKKFPQRLNDRVLARITNKIIVVSNGVKDFLIEKGKIPENKIEVIYNGVDIEKFNIDVDIDKKKRTFGIKPKEKIVGIVSRIVSQKGHMVLLKSAEKILQIFPNTKFLIVGDGEKKLLKELQEKALSLGIENRCLFTGLRQDIPEIMAIMDIFAFPSFREGLGNVLLEAMASGKPVVANYIHGVVDEVVANGETGFLVPPDNPALFTERIVRLLKSKSLREKMGQEAKKRVLNFSIDRMVRETEVIYDRLIRQKLIASS